MQDAQNQELTPRPEAFRKLDAIKAEMSDAIGEFVRLNRLGRNTEGAELLVTADGSLGPAMGSGTEILAQMDQLNAKSGRLAEEYRQEESRLWLEIAGVERINQGRIRMDQEDPELSRLRSIAWAKENPGAAPGNE